ncbi:Ubiquitin-like domain-containing CTD phosphatase [Capsicum annuum]|nr:Ubiquitin-like domain-containing CTD phosphatase [Capsicum annuum]KAF3647469.1 Ubiquitin-like domain-containing CTD phosphatase [Capsicum annuum]
MASESSSAVSAVSPVTAEELTLTVKWSGKEHTVRVCCDDTVGELKRRICEVTNVLPKRQKLLYPKVGSKLADDSLLLSQIPLKASLKMTMIGKCWIAKVLYIHKVHVAHTDNNMDAQSKQINKIRNDHIFQQVQAEDTEDKMQEGRLRWTIEEDIFVDQVESPDIIDDFELELEETVDIKDKEINQQKLRRRIEQHKIVLRNPCRQGKKLLVLDIDYTLFDHRSTAENPLELMRPYLHEFLSAAYTAYDIMIWSATSMRWVELKMGQLGVLNHPNFKITALLDHMAMITVQSDHHGVFDCKPLGLIWAQFPEFYSPQNTIMFDDLRRNFAMNPQSGLVIKPFRKAHANRSTDEELMKLTQYLYAISDIDDLTLLDHRDWEFFDLKSFKRRRRNA